MNAEIISIGSELTTGKNLDTNSQWLSRRLAEVGIPVGWHTTIADDLDANLEAFRIATRRAKLVLATGGLGPTQDDLTREVLAKVAGVELEFHPELLAYIEDLFRRRKRSMPESNRVQAYCPAGAEPLHNACGTAPGIWLRIGDCHVGAMPGVPTEMFDMFEKQIRPRLQSLDLARGVILERKINCFGASESGIEEKLLDLTKRGHEPEVGITASDATISLRIFGRGPTREDALCQIAPVEQTIRERLGDLVFGADDEDLHDVVVRLLEEKRKSLATAESVTGGQVAERLCRVPGASAWFRGGVVAYDPHTKMQLLGVPQGLIDAHGAVSREVAEAMAVGCRTLMNTDLAVATTGLAGPGGGTPEKPVGLVYVALAWEGGVTSTTWSWLSTRAEVQSRTAKMALNLVRLRLQASGAG
jgi:nicotinamide-nucleotide amidase